MKLVVMRNDIIFMKDTNGSAPVLAVIIPTFNSEKYIEEAIISVLNQPKKDVVVIAVNDGSTDSTPSLLQQIKEQDERLIILSQENKGVSVARNKGIDESIRLGVKYIAFLDGDDVWCKNIYDIDLINKLKLDKYDLVGFGYYNASNKCSKERYRAANKSLEKYTSSFSSFLYSVRLFKKYKLRYPEGVNFNEDKAFYFLYSFYSKTYYYYEKALFMYRTNYESALHIKQNLDVQYFNHIIPAWDWVGKQIDGNSAAFRECETMKKTMVTEYILEACKSGYSIKRIKKAIANSKLNYFTKNDDVWIDSKSEKVFYSFYKQPLFFWSKNRLNGLIIRIGKIVKIFLERIKIPMR